MSVTTQPDGPHALFAPFLGHPTLSHVMESIHKALLNAGVLDAVALQALWEDEATSDIITRTVTEAIKGSTLSAPLVLVQLKQRLRGCVGSDATSYATPNTLSLSIGMSCADASPRSSTPRTSGGIFNDLYQASVQCTELCLCVVSSPECQKAQGCDRWRSFTPPAKRIAVRLW